MVKATNGDITERLSVLSSVVGRERHPEKTSDKYGLVPTTDVIEVLKDLGMVPVAARQASTREERNNGFQKHMVTLRFASDAARMFDVNDEIPQLLLTNSHMGSASFRLMLSIWRCVCANQLVVQSSSLLDIRIGHNRYAPERVADALGAVIEVLPRVNENIQQFKAIELSTGEQKALADAVIPLRFDTETHRVEPSDLLQVNRYADRAPTLWNTFNTIQENVIKGGVTTRATSPDAVRRYARSKRVTGIDADVKLNTALWALTEKMAELKGASL